MSMSACNRPPQRIYMCRYKRNATTWTDKQLSYLLVRVYISFFIVLLESKQGKTFDSLGISISLSVDSSHMHKIYVVYIVGLEVESGS